MDRDEFRVLYLDGLTDEDIAERLGFALSTVRSVRKTMGYPRNLLINRPILSPREEISEPSYWASAIDHDGWIIIARRLPAKYSPTHTLIIGYGQKTERMVRACHTFFGVGRANPGNYIWQWTASSLMAVNCLKMIEPHLRLKREQANLGIEFQETRVNFRGGFPPRRISSEEFKKRDGYYFRMKELNGGGGRL